MAACVASGPDHGVWSDHELALLIHKEEVEKLIGGVEEEEESGEAPIHQVCSEIVWALNAEVQELNDMKVAADFSRSNTLALSLTQQFEALRVQEAFDHTLSIRLAGGQARPAASQQQRQPPSLLQLSLDRCITQRINVCDALQRGRAKVLRKSVQYQGDALILGGGPVEDEDDEEEESKVEHGAEESKENDPPARRRSQLELGFKPVRVTNCMACLGEAQEGAVLLCNHEICRACLRGLHATALTDVSLFPLRCCKQLIPSEVTDWILRRHGNELPNFKMKEAEATARDKMYCPKPSCSAFINLDLVDASETNGVLDCYRCSTSMCTLCKSEWHPAQSCEQAEALRNQQEDASVVSLAREQGWQRCGQCKALVQLVVGCNHMTCRCGNEFCYVCGSAWYRQGTRMQACNCEFWEEGRLVRQAEAEVGVRAQGVNPLVHQARLQRRVQQLRHHDDCEHDWIRVEGRQLQQRNCNNCGFFLSWYGFRCRDACGNVVCNTCRFHRLR